MLCYHPFTPSLLSMAPAVGFRRRRNPGLGLLTLNAPRNRALITGAKRVRASARTVARSGPKAFFWPVGCRPAGLRAPRVSRRSSDP